MAWLTPGKYAPPPSPYVLSCPIWSFCVKWCRYKYRRTPQNGEPWNSAPLEWKAWLTHESPRVATSNLLNSSATKDVRINRKEPQNCKRPLAVGAWLTPENKPPPHIDLFFSFFYCFYCVYCVYAYVCVYDCLSAVDE